MVSAALYKISADVEWPAHLVEVKTILPTPFLIILPTANVAPDCPSKNPGLVLAVSITNVPGLDNVKFVVPPVAPAVVLIFDNIDTPFVPFRVTFPPLPPTPVPVLFAPLDSIYPFAAILTLPAAVNVTSPPLATVSLDTDWSVPFNFKPAWITTSFTSACITKFGTGYAVSEL